MADYQNAFQLPNDFLRGVSAGSGGRGRGVNYRIHQGALHTDSEDIVLSYIYRPQEVDFPPYFDMALIVRLSAEFCIPITENTSRFDALHRMAEGEYAKARQIDAQQDSPNRLENFSLIDVRG